MNFPVAFPETSSLETPCSSEESRTNHPALDISHAPPRQVGPPGGGHRELTSQLSQCNNGPTQRVTTFLDRAGNAIKGHGVLLAAAPTAATAPGAAATNFCRIIAVPPPVEG